MAKWESTGTAVYEQTQSVFPSEHSVMYERWMLQYDTGVREGNVRARISRAPSQSANGRNFMGKCGGTTHPAPKFAQAFACGETAY
jgi:hypothetical protein